MMVALCKEVGGVFSGLFGVSTTQEHKVKRSSLPLSLYIYICGCGGGAICKPLQLNLDSSTTPLSFLPTHESHIDVQARKS